MNPLLPPSLLGKGARGLGLRHRLHLAALFLALLLAGCAARPASQTAPQSPAQGGPVTLNVFAAASLTGPFTEIGALFEARRPGVTVTFNFAGSQQLARQIIEGAPADVFASANAANMDGAVEAGSVAAGAPQTFARNRLVVVLPKDNPASLNSLQDLARPGLKLVFAAQEVPVGQYSLDFLEKASADPAFEATFKDGVIRNVVSYEDNVKAVLAKVALGEADAGIVYSSDAAGEDAARVGRLDIPESLNVVAGYPIAPVAASKNPALAQAFVDLALSPEGQAVLAKYGFIPVK